jgi:hypothetical protein
MFLEQLAYKEKQIHCKNAPAILAEPPPTIIII